MFDDDLYKKVCWSSLIPWLENSSVIRQLGRSSMFVVEDLDDAEHREMVAAQNVNYVIRKIINKNKGTN